MNKKEALLGTLAVLVLAAVVLLSITGEKDHIKWAEENGYIKMAPDIVSSATTTKVGGVNYGAIEWNSELQKAAIREFLKGGTYLGSADYAQDETGRNYREMYQMATSYNNIPTNTNLELVLDADSLHLLGVSEAGTTKTLHFSQNPNVSISWCRQLRPHEEDTYNYFCSYGVQYDGKVRVYTAGDLKTEEGTAALLNLFDKYYPTLASSWGTYSAAFAGLTDETAIREAKLAFISNILDGDSMVIYEVIPGRIVLTAPFLINISPSMSNGDRFTRQQAGSDKYQYDLELSDAFLDRLVAYKNAHISTESGLEAVNAYYAAEMFQTLDELCVSYGVPTSLELALMPSNAAGLNTQTVYIPAGK